MVAIVHSATSLVAWLCSAARPSPRRYVSCHLCLHVNPKHLGVHLLYKSSVPSLQLPPFLLAPHHSTTKHLLHNSFLATSYSLFHLHQPTYNHTFQLSTTTTTTTQTSSCLLNSPTVSATSASSTASTSTPCSRASSTAPTARPRSLSSRKRAAAPRPRPLPRPRLSTPAKTPSSLPTPSLSPPTPRRSAASRPSSAWPALARTAVSSASPTSCKQSCLRHATHLVFFPQNRQPHDLHYNDSAEAGGSPIHDHMKTRTKKSQKNNNNQLSSLLHGRRLLTLLGYTWHWSFAIFTQSHIDLRDGFPFYSTAQYCLDLLLFFFLIRRNQIKPQVGYTNDSPFALRNKSRIPLVTATWDGKS